MKTALVIMAAGIGSRFGGGIKQLAAVGPNGEIIMDYSIHDAIEAGFDKIVFIIRHDIEEAFKEAIGNRIEKTADGAAVEGKAIDPESLVSMNFWGLTPEFVKVLEDGFVEFFEKSVPANPLKAEYLLPIYIGELLEKNAVTVQVLPTHDKWFGVTYKEDKQTVIDSFAKLVADGVYQKNLFSDLKH